MIAHEIASEIVKYGMAVFERRNGRPMNQAEENAVLEAIAATFQKPQNDSAQGDHASSDTNTQPRPPNPTSPRQTPLKWSYNFARHVYTSDGYGYSIKHDGNDWSVCDGIGSPFAAARIIAITNSYNDAKALAQLMRDSGGPDQWLKTHGFTAPVKYSL